MARGLSKDTQGLRGTTQQTAATSEPKSKSAQPANSRITSLAAVPLLCAGTVFLVALLLYSWTLAPTVTLTDSGELIVVARGLGIAHPPGVPLWIILAHLASLVPFGNVAQRINFSSALFAALACAMLTLVVAELIDYSVISRCGRSDERKSRSRVRKPTNGCCASYGGCACAGRGFAHGVFPHALVVCDDHRGLFSECTAHRRYLLSDASMAATHRRRQDAYLGTAINAGEVIPKARRFSLCGCADVRPGVSAFIMSPWR